MRGLSGAAEVDPRVQEFRVHMNLQGPDANFVVDSPGALGGPNEEINPLDLLLAAQGTCGTFIIEKVAQDGGIPLTAVSAAVEADFNPQGLRDGSVSPHIQAMRIHWQITGPDSTQAQALVDAWVKRCPIYNTLIRATGIEVSIN